MNRITVLVIGLLLSFQAVGGPLAPREGWEVIETGQRYETLLQSLRTAVETEQMFVVTEVGPTEAAARRGETIPGNRVVGVFRNDFAVRVLRASIPAMIEAPIRFYVTEKEDGTSTLSWKTPSHVFEPYFSDGGDHLRSLATELDTIFEAIGRRAAGN